MFLSSDLVKSVSFSPCGGRIASASTDCTIKVWEASTGTCQSTLSVDSNVYSVAFSPNGEEIVAGCGRCIYLWRQAEDGGDKKWVIQSVCPLTVDAGFFGMRSVCFSPTDNVIAAGCGNGNIYLVDAQAGEVKSSLSGHRYDPFPCIECLLL